MGEESPLQTWAGGPSWAQDESWAPWGEVLQVAGLGLKAMVGQGRRGCTRGDSALERQEALLFTSACFHWLTEFSIVFQGLEDLEEDTSYIPILTQQQDGFCIVFQDLEDSEEVTGYILIPIQQQIGFCMSSKTPKTWKKLLVTS